MLFGFPMPLSPAPCPAHAQRSRTTHRIGLLTSFRRGRIFTRQELPNRGIAIRPVRNGF